MTAIDTSSIATITVNRTRSDTSTPNWQRSQGIDPAALIAGKAASQKYPNRNGRVKEPTQDLDNVPPHLHQTYWCTEKTVEFIQKNRRENQPWLLSINPFDPHPPFDAPWEYYRRYDPETLPGPHFQESDIAFQSKLTDAGIDFQSQAKTPAEWDDKRMQASYYAMIEQLEPRVRTYPRLSGCRRAS